MNKKVGGKTDKEWEEWEENLAIASEKIIEKFFKGFKFYGIRFRKYRDDKYLKISFE